ncbi:hypothetical protein PCANB_000023 [Pneumocystis canis]|nr:hypothetical protein PCANB_000023 [Pneumocystis canis]
MHPILNIQTPQTEAGTVNSIDAEELTFGSREPSFVSPNKKDNWKFFKGISTPAPTRVFIDRTNALSNLKREFTPLLQSATKNELSHFKPQKKLDFETSVQEKSTDSLGSNNQQISSSSIVSVKSIIDLPDTNTFEKEGNGMTLTLREQERIINAMRKENWGLKLKIHFLNDRLDKLAPDQIETALKEQAKLVQEIKKYRKSLFESEKRMHAVSENKDKDKEYNEIISEQKKVLDKVVLENNQYADELFKAREKIQILSKKIEELENMETKVDVTEKLNHLQEQLQQVLEKNENMRTELEIKQTKIDEQNDEIELQEEEQNKLKEIIEELKQKYFSKEQDREINEYIKQINSLKNDLDIVKEKLDEKEKTIQELVLEKGNSNELCDELEKTRSELNRISTEYYEFKNIQKEKIYNLEKSCNNLNNELGAKKEEIASLHKQLEAGEFSHLDKDKNIQEIHNILNEKYKLEKDLKEAYDDIKELHINLEEYDDRQEELKENLKQKEEELSKTVFNLELLQNEFNAFKLEYEKEKKDFLNQIIESNQNWDEERMKLIDETQSTKVSFKQYQDHVKSTLLTLQEEKNILQNKLEEITQQNLELQQNISNLVETESAISKNNEKFQEVLQNEERHRKYEAQLQNQINNQNIQYENQKKEFDRVLNDFYNLQEDFKQIQRSEELLKDDIKSLTIEYNELQQQHTQQKETIKETNDEMFHFRKEYEKLKTEYEFAELTIKDLRNEKKDLSLLIEQIKSDNKEKADTTESLNETIKILERQVESIKTERNKLSKSIDSLNVDIMNYQNTVSNLEKERDFLKKKIEFSDTHDKSSLLLDEKYFELQKNINMLETQVKLLETEKESLKETNTDLENRLNNALKNMDDKEMCLIHEYKIKRIELEEIIRTKEYEQENLTKRIKQLETTLSDKEQTHKTKIEQLNDEILLLQNQLQDFKLQQKETLELKNSDEFISNLQRDIFRLKNELYDIKSKETEKHKNYEVDNYEIELSELKLKYKNANEIISKMRHETLAREEEFQCKINEIILREKSKLRKLQNEKARIESSLFHVTEEKAALEKEKEHLRKQISLLETNAVLTGKGYTDKDENMKIIQEKEELEERLILTKAELNEIKGNMRTREIQLKEQLYKIDKDKHLLINKIEMAEKKIQSITREKKEITKKVYYLEKQLQENGHSLYNNQSYLKKNTNFNNLLSKELFALKSKHKAELRGLSKQIYYLKACVSREEQFRASLSYTKKFFLMKIDSYESCNQANLRLIEKMGIYPDRSFKQNRITLRIVVLAIIIIGRMKLETFNRMVEADKDQRKVIQIIVINSDS